MWLKCSTGKSGHVVFITHYCCVLSVFCVVCLKREERSDMFTEAWQAYLGSILIC